MQENLQHSELLVSKNLSGVKAGCSLMTTEFSVWVISINPLQCAYDNDLYDFIAHPCAQRCLNKIWYNELGTNFNAAVKVQTILLKA
jgi:hypothetical protein